MTTATATINKSEVMEHGGVFIEAECGKHAAQFLINESYVQVFLISNASHRAWGGAGKCFHGGFAEALNHYKRPAMKLMVTAARCKAVELGLVL